MTEPIVKSFNGVAINTGGLFALFSRESQFEARRSSAVLVEPAGRFPIFVRGQQSGRTIPVHVLIQSGTLQDQIDLLMKTFSLGTTGELVVDYGGTDRVLDATIIDAIPRDQMPQRFTAVLSVPDPRWREASANLEVDTINTSGDTFAITNMGNAREDKPIFRVRPSNLKEGSEDFRYSTEIIIANRVDRPYFEPLDVVENAWNHSAEVVAGRSQADGDDVRVLVDGVEVPRWPDGLNTTTAKLWINAQLAPGIEAKLASAITAGSPANGADLPLETNGADPLPEAGHIVFGDELIKYTGKTRSTLTGITRGARGTTAASHSAGDVGYWVQRRVQLMYGYTGATAPVARDELKPMLDLATSTNDSWVWNDFAHETDPRSAQWTRELQTSRDNQAARILLPSGEPMASVVFEYQEDGAESGKPAFNVLRKTIPAGTANGGGGNAISCTRAIDSTLALKVLGKDNDGNEEELSVEGGEVASGTLNVSEPAQPIFEAAFQVRSQVIESNPVGTQTSSIPFPTSYDSTAQQFTAPSSGPCAGVEILIQQGVSTATTYRATLYSDDGSDAPGVAISAQGQFTTPAAIFSETPVLMTWAPVDLVAGTKYWINVNASNPGFTPTVRTFQIPYPGLAMDSGVIEVGEVFKFKVLMLEGVAFGSFATATDGDQVTIDAVTVTLDSAKTPYINQLARADAYWLDGTLKSDTTGQELTLAILCALNDDIKVDVGNRTVTNITADEPADYGLEASDQQNWIYLEPGGNTLRWTEENMDQVVIDTDHLGRWE